MNFAYLDARDIMERLIGPVHEPLVPETCELDDSWKKFEKELGKFKLECAVVQRELNHLMTELDRKRDDVDQLRAASEGVTNQDLKVVLENMIDNYVVDSGLSALTQQCRELMGRYEAMNKVLKDTNAERYASFTCFVCMERMVNLFLEPCGHVICDQCWARTPARGAPHLTCPGCRSDVRAARKIFTLS
jgi:Zinc finger, C3HC4 type (RING finger)